eukprot:GHVR01028403.1.p1 GENE.GHVR01028403.1~~GHVR01028403.1.p1  ORF type:complete len:100 (+),score=10.46 GHVR01028403.1:2612-2911(+)
MIDTQELFEDRMEQFKRTIRKFKNQEVKAIEDKGRDEQEYEGNKIIKESKERDEEFYDKKFKGIQVDIKIIKSRKINDLRMSKMKVRFEIIEKVQDNIK